MLRNVFGSCIFIINFLEKWKVNQLCPTLMDYTTHEIVQAGVLGSLSLLQGIFPTQGSNTGLPHCWQILYQLSHKGIHT